MTAIVLFALLADAGSLVREGNELFRAGDIEKAEAKYLDAQVDAPESPILAFNVGNVYLARQDYAKARDCFQRALATRDPGFEAKIKYNMGHTHFGEAQTGLADLGDPEKVGRTVEFLHQSIARWRDVLKLEPENAGARQNIAVATSVLKDYLDRVKRYQEEQRKKEEEEKGKDLAQILEDLIKRQTEERGRTDRIVTLRAEREKFLPLKETYERLAGDLEEALADGAAPAERERVEGDVAKLLADPGVVDGAGALQEVKNALAASPPDRDAARSAMGKAAGGAAAEVAKREETSTAEAKTGTEKQKQLEVETQGVVQGIEARLAGGPAAAGKAPDPKAAPPGQQPLGPEPPAMPPEQRKLFEDVKPLVAKAVGHQTEALKNLAFGDFAVDKLTQASAEQQEAADRLGEALDLLRKEQEKQEKQQGDEQEQKQDKKDEQKQDQQKQDGRKQEKKSLSRQEAEEILRRMKEKEQEKKREKEEQLMRALGRQKVENDW